MKEILFQIKKRAVFLAKWQIRKLKRLLTKTTLSLEDSYNVPIVINNRNRYTYLKNFVDWLQDAGYKSIYILDNDSDYPELLNYYFQTTATVIFLKKNRGYKALWEIDFFEKIKTGYYVYTDSDLIPNPNCPKDFVYQLYLILRKYNIEKCGPALRIDDLPDWYARKQEVINHEKKYWQAELEPLVFDAPIDTTFALYKPLAFGDAEELKAYRVGGKFTFVHLPWYENSSDLNPEAKYYQEHVSSSSFWYNKK